MGENAAAKVRQEVAEGLLYLHTRVADNGKRTAEAASFVYGLIELLSEKGLISIDEVDERKKIIGERLVRQARDKGIGVLLQDPEIDKYTTTETAEIDCDKRVHLCKAACCKLPFALSKQDIYEGVVHWDLGQPYMIAQKEDGYCTHFQADGCRCTVREQRPLPCRAYDCRQDKKIWLDFDNRVINPEILRADWPRGVVEPRGEQGRP
jgi:Fe-S-cluster containining protein